MRIFLMGLASIAAGMVFAVILMWGGLNLSADDRACGCVPVVRVLFRENPGMMDGQAGEPFSPGWLLAYSRGISVMRERTFLFLWLAMSILTGIILFAFRRAGLISSCGEPLIA